MILSLPVGWTARLQAERAVPRDSHTTLRNDLFKVRRWPEGDRTAGAMASIAPGAASPYPTGIPHPSEPPTSSQPERWRLPWRRRQCQPSTGIRGFGEVRDRIVRPFLMAASAAFGLSFSDCARAWQVSKRPSAPEERPAAGGAGGAAAGGAGEAVRPSAAAVARPSRPKS